MKTLKDYEIEIRKTKQKLAQLILKTYVEHGKLLIPVDSISEIMKLIFDSMEPGKIVTIPEILGYVLKFNNTRLNGILGYSIRTNINRFADRGIIERVDRGKFRIL